MLRNIETSISAFTMSELEINERIRESRDMLNELLDKCSYYSDDYGGTTYKLRRYYEQGHPLTTIGTAPMFEIYTSFQITNLYISVGEELKDFSLLQCAIETEISLLRTNPRYTEEPSNQVHIKIINMKNKFMTPVYGHMVWLYSLKKYLKPVIYEVSKQELDINLKTFREEIQELSSQQVEIRDQLEEIKTIKTHLLTERETLKKEKEEFAEEKLQHNEEKEELKKQLEEIRFMRREIQQEKERLELERLRREFEKEKELLKQEQQKLEEERVQVVMERGRLIAQKLGVSK